MIKNLLNADEDPPPGTKVVIEDSVVNPPVEQQSTEAPPGEESSENLETRQVFEIPEDAKFFINSSEIIDETGKIEEIIDSPSNQIIEMVSGDSEPLKPVETESEKPPVVEPIGNEKMDNMPSGILFQSEAKPQSTGETIRQSGLAYSAAIVLFGSVVFMMIFGWFADLILGSSPWGIACGIVLGGIIGFIQFFRITSQIFKK